MERNDDPFYRYTDEQRMNMTREEYCALIEESNEYVRRKHSQTSKQETLRFNTIEELRAYYNCMPLDEAVRKMNSSISELLDEEDRISFENIMGKVPSKEQPSDEIVLSDEDREQEEFIEQCRRELEAHIREINSK